MKNFSKDSDEEISNIKWILILLIKILFWVFIIVFKIIENIKVFFINFITPEKFVNYTNINPSDNLLNNQKYIIKSRDKFLIISIRNLFERDYLWNFFYNFIYIYTEIKIIKIIKKVLYIFFSIILIFMLYSIFMMFFELNVYITKNIKQITILDPKDLIIPILTLFSSIIIIYILSNIKVKIWGFIKFIFRIIFLVFFYFLFIKIFQISNLDTLNIYHSFLFSFSYVLFIILVILNLSKENFKKTIYFLFIILSFQVAYRIKLNGNYYFLQDIFAIYLLTYIFLIFSYISIHKIISYFKTIAFLSNIKSDNFWIFLSKPNIKIQDIRSTKLFIDDLWTKETNIWSLLSQKQIHFWNLFYLNLTKQEKVNIFNKYNFLKVLSLFLLFVIISLFILVPTYYSYKGYNHKIEIYKQAMFFKDIV